MDISPDFEELFKILNAYGIKYLLVGGHAVIFYSVPRFTKDIDVWISPDLNDPQTIYKALIEFGAPLKNIKPEAFADKKNIYQIGVHPVRIDILMDVQGISAKDAWNSRTKTKFGRTALSVIGIKDLIRAKKIANRPQDKLDVRHLEKALAKKMRRKKPRKQ